MARWKARVELSVIELLFLSLTVEALQGKRCQASLLSGGSVRAKISVGIGRPWGVFVGFYKTRHILLSDSANCTVLRAVVSTQYQRVTDGRTDGNAVASTSLAKRRGVKRNFVMSDEKDFRLLFYGYVRPHLQYCVQVWSPFPKKEIECLEKVQRRATKFVKELKNKPYADRLAVLYTSSLVKMALGR